MPSAREFLGLPAIQPSARGFLGLSTSPTPIEPAPFNMDDVLNKWLTAQPDDELAQKQNGITETLYNMARPWLATGYNAAAALNRGLGVFSTHMDAMSELVGNKTGTQPGNLFKQIAETYDQNTEYWKNRANTVGSKFLDELVGEAVGGAVPGIAEFLLNIPYAGILGAAEAKQKGENKILGALVSAGKRGVLGGIFKALDPLKQYLRAPAMGSVFAVDTAAQGGKPEEIAKAFGTGALYSMSSPGGEMGLNDLVRGTNRQIAQEKAQDTIKQEVPPEKIAENVEAKPGETWEEFRANNGFTVALKDKEGNTYEGNPGEIHASLADRLGLDTNNISEDGFIDKKGNYYNEKDVLALHKDVSEPSIGVGATAHPAVEEYQPDGGVAGGKVTPGEPQEADRGFIQTALKEKSQTSERAKEEIRTMAETDPFVYNVEHNPDSVSKADARIAADPVEAEKYVLSDTPFSAEKGATFIRLAEKAQREGDFQKEVTLLDNYATQLTRAGQFVQSASIWTKATPQGFLLWAEKQIERVNANKNWIDNFLGGKKAELTNEDKTYIVQEMERINQLPPGTEKLNATMKLIDDVAKSVPPTVSEIIDAYRYQNMLSGLRTQERHLGERAMNIFMTRPLMLTTRGAMDFMGATLFGKEREAYMADVPEYYKAVFNAFPNAWMAFKSGWKSEMGLESPELGKEFQGAFQKARFEQMPKYLTIVQRFFDASQRFYQTLMSTGEYASNMRNGMSESEAFDAAQSTAEQYLYKTRPFAELSYPSKMLEGVGKMIEFGRRLPAIGKPFGWFVPFVRVPINKGIMLTEFSPLGAIRTGGWDAEVASRVIVGSMVSAVGAYFALNGDTTWTPPTEEKDKEWYYATGRKPFSVKIGENWVPLWYLGPFALAFGLPAAAKHYYQERKESLSDDAIDSLGKITGGVIRFLASQSSVQSLGNLMAMLDGDLQYNQWGKQGALVLGQTIPANSLVKQISNLLDPVYRQPKGFVESLMQNYPMLSQQLPARKEPFGELSERQWYNTFLPYDWGKVKEEYQSMYPMMQTQQRAEFLKNKMESIMKDVSKGEIEYSDGVDQVMKLMESTPRITEPLLNQREK
jgi:hypothetical protein